MRANRNIPLSTYYCILAFCVVMLCVVSTVVFHEYVKTREYIQIDAVIAEKSKELDYGLQDNSHVTVIHKITCVYEVDNVKYTSEFRTFFPFGKNAGDVVKLYYSPTNPNTTRNHFLIEAGLCGIAFLLVFFAGLLAAIHAKKLTT